MGKKGSLSEAQRAQIVILRQEGYTERAISERLSVSKTAVHQAVVKFKNCGSYSDCTRSGRPRKTTRRNDILIERCVVKPPTCSAKKIRAELGETGSRISRRTNSRRLTDEFGLKSRKPARKPRLASAMKLKRLQFAKKYKDWTSQQWSRVLFSDETTIQQFTSRKRTVRRPPGTRYITKIHIANHETPAECDDLGSDFNPRNGRSILPRSRNHHEWQKYLQLMKEKLELHMAVHNCEIFMHDGAPCHGAKIVTDFLKTKNIKLLEWPGNRPELNPIENFWTELKNRVVEKHPTSLPSLIKTIKTSWVLDMPTELCRNLIESMPRRIRAVLEAKGGHTKY